MFKKRKQVYFVCSAINADQLISEEIPTSSEEEAVNLFKNKYNVNCQKLLGPFYKKRVLPVEINKNIQFSGQIKKATYLGWRVNAFFLKEPADYAFLVFIKSLDNSPAPKNISIVPIKDLRIE